MINFEIGTLVDKPIEEVFTFLSNPLNTPKWQAMIKKVEQIIPGVVGPGSQFNVQAEMMGRIMMGVMEVKAFEPPNKFAFTNKSGPVEVNITFTLKPVGSGTKVNIAVEGNPGGLFKLAEGPMTHQLKAQMEANIAKLKSVLEAMI
jgi:carbon monoxide dehydrogenase subunit G